MEEEVVKETKEQYEERFVAMMFYLEQIAALLSVENLSDSNKTSLNIIMSEHITKFQYKL